jgi:DinB superfamily
MMTIGENHAAAVGSPADRFQVVSDVVLTALGPLTLEDWNARAGNLEWTCWQTLDHMIDCVFSYALQLASRAHDRLLPFGELHALPGAKPVDLVTALAGITELFCVLLRSVPGDVVASDGLVTLDIDDWAARAAYELVLHTSDITAGLGVQFDPPLSICAWVLDSPNLWMLDRSAAAMARDAWEGLLVGSGR